MSKQSRGAAVDIPDIQQKLQNLEGTFAPLIGKINMAWGDAQYWVYASFYYLMKEDILRSEAIFFTLRSDDAQRKVTLEVAEKILPFCRDPTLLEDTREAINKLAKLAGKRNDAIHAMWTLNLKGEPTLAAASSPRLAGQPLAETLEATYYDIIETALSLCRIAQRIKALVASFPPVPNQLFVERGKTE